MSLQPQTMLPVPEETARVARAAFPKGNLYLQIRDEIGGLADSDLTELIHQSLEKKRLLPTSHLADTGLVDAELIVAAKTQYQIDLLGPAHLDQQWQSRHNPKFCGENFSIDWHQKKAVCPAGKTSSSLPDAKTDTAKQVVKIKFSMKGCQPCLLRADCTKSGRARRTLRFCRKSNTRVSERCMKERRPENIERNINSVPGLRAQCAQATRGFGMRHSRYIGASKTHLQQVVSATAINVVSVTNWLREVLLAKTREPLFAKVMRE